MLLVEPLGLIAGPDASEAVAAGLAMPLRGGPLAFTLARLIDADPAPADAPGHAVIVRVPQVPPRFRDSLQRLALAPPSWAGLPVARPLVMGILNVTPDSFSDGGRYLDPQAAIAAGRAMAASGADLIDVGGESTRPGSLPVAAEVEQARILPVIAALAADGAILSVDTRKASTAAAALAAGARIVNDVSALRHDPGMAALVAARRCPVILMHMRGEPATMMELTSYTDVAVDVTRELAARLSVAAVAGITPGQIAVDPGFGFAKGLGQNEILLRRLGVLLNLGCPVVVGVSRKGFIGRLAQEPVGTRRVCGSITAGLQAAAAGAAIIRVHDVAETVQAVRVWRALVGMI